MLLNELPGDCLLSILDYIQDIKDLINLFKGKVCRQILYYFTFIVYAIAEFAYSHDGKAPIGDMIKLIRGIIFDCDYHLDFGCIPENANLEMLSTGYIYPNISGIYGNVKQLHLWNTNLGLFKCAAHRFPNLERLKIYATEDLREEYSDAPVLANLKILEMGLPLIDCVGTCCSFKFMDGCSALQSAHIRIDSSRITFNRMINYQSSEWIELPRCMSKYPNLKHLAIRGTYLKDVTIKQLILILPKLTLLDVRKSYGVTQEAADHVQDYCKRYGRSIKFYFKRDDKQIEADWPQSLNPWKKVCRGFDFMEHCFFKSFYQLPNFLDPVDD
uniref:F-box domain-containing protein n=1 Tax=Tetranychus urticae TaxID=32264 RepID=T1L5M6_TETUR